VRRIIDHRGPHRVEFDVSVDGQGIALRVDLVGSEAAFPQRPGAAMATIERADVALVEPPPVAQARKVATELNGLGAELACLDAKEKKCLRGSYCDSAIKAQKRRVEVQIQGRKAGISTCHPDK
jgi:hypothetical protein